jgi:hypothetical protein
VTSVTNGQKDVVPSYHFEVPGGILLVYLHVSGLYRQRAAARHGISRVDREVDDHLLELRAIHSHRP